MQDTQAVLAEEMENLYFMMNHQLEMASNTSKFLKEMDTRINR